MLDVAPTELMLVALVALLVIGPKDLPRVMHHVGKWVGRAKGMAAQFRSGFDAMTREFELEEMEKAWAKENERIMREHPNIEATPADPPHAATKTEASAPALEIATVESATSDAVSEAVEAQVREVPTAAAPVDPTSKLDSAL